MSASARAREAVRLRRWGEAGNAALCAALCFLFGALVLQPWRGSLGVPYLYRGDSTLYQASVKGVLDHGWYWHNASLGAPGQAQLFDFPSLGGDPLNVLVFEFLGQRRREQFLALGTAHFLSRRGQRRELEPG